MKIPKHIYCTLGSKDIPKHFNIWKAFKLLSVMSPGYQISLFDDNDCREFIKNNFDKTILYCYDMLLPGAYRADFWRYCVLYKNGGIYVDAGLKLMVNLDRYLDYDLILVKDLDNTGTNIYNAFMCSTPNNEFLKYLIYKVCSKIKTLSYGGGAFDITGPSICGQSFKEFFNIPTVTKNMFIKSRKQKIKILYLHNDICIYDINTMIFYKKRDGGSYSNEMAYIEKKVNNKWLKNFNSKYYQDLYHQRKVYKCLTFGSWHKSCTNYSLKPPYLVATCKSISGEDIENTIKYRNIEYHNMNGVLWYNDHELNKLDKTIPKLIFQTHKNIEYIKENEKLKEAQDSWTKWKEYQYKFYDDTEQDKFIKDQFIKIYPLYTNLPFGRMKANLWRLCIIYAYGGIYADADTNCKSTPDKLIQNSLFCGVPKNSNYLSQSIFSAPPKSPLIKHIITFIIKNIVKYSKDSIEINKIEKEQIDLLTGPGIFTKAFESWLLINYLPVFKTNKKFYKNYPKDILNICDE